MEYCLAESVLLCLRVHPCLVAVGFLLPTSWDASEHHPSSCYQVAGYAHLCSLEAIVSLMLSYLKKERKENASLYSP